MGNYPESWFEKPLKYADAFSADSLSESTNPEYRFRYVDISSVSNERGVERYAETSFAECPSRARKRVHAGDVIVSTVRTYLKAIALIEDSENVIVSTGFSVIRPVEHEPRYLHYLCCSESFCQQVNKYAWGVSYPAISESLMGGIKVPVPPKAEQQAIAAFLDRECAAIDATTATLEAQISTLERYRASVIHEAVTRGLDPVAPTKPSNVDWIGDIPEGWELTRLKYKASICNGLDYSAEDVCSPEDEDAVLVVRSSNIASGKMVHADDVYVCMPIPEPCRLKPDDLVIVRANGSATLVGKSALFTLDESAAAGGFMLICRSEANRYLRWLLQSDLLGFYRGQFATTTISRISSALLGNMLVPWPGKKERALIADYLDERTAAIDAVISTKRDQLDVLKRRRQSLIYEYVTGKRRVAEEE